MGCPSLIFGMELSMIGTSESVKSREKLNVYTYNMLLSEEIVFTFDVSLPLKNVLSTHQLA